MSRRTVVLVGLAGVAVGAGALALALLLFDPPSSASLEAVPTLLFQDLGTVTEVDVDRAFFIPVPLDGDPTTGVGTAEGARLYLVADDARVAAFLARSPFLGCRLTLALGEEAEQMFGWAAPDPAAFVFVDPCHGGIYSLAGEHLHGPGGSGMVAFPTGFTSDGVVTVDLTRPSVVGSG